MADQIISIREHDRRPVPANAPDETADWPAWPTYSLIDDLLPVLARWAQHGRRAALATLVEVTGSSPRPLGSEMAISDAGDIAGYVSGGCVEAAVALQAKEVLANGRPVMLDYGAGSPVLDVQLTCGGRIGIFVRALPDLGAYVRRLQWARERRLPIEVLINLEDGSQTFDQSPRPSSPRIFRKTYLPPPRLIVAGSDPVTLVLCRLAPDFGYETILLRPYGPPAPPAGTAPVHYDTRPLARALQAVKPDTWSAVYTLTHDLDDDHAVLMHALASDAFSVGALGSRMKTDQRKARLRADGLSADRIARLKTPAGLEIDARQPHEIALSILAELVALRPRAVDAIIR